MTLDLYFDANAHSRDERHVLLRFLLRQDGWRAEALLGPSRPHHRKAVPVSFWDIIWFIIVSFAFIAYLMVLFSIIGDLFRDRTVSGVAKAAWIFALIFFTPLTALVYLIVRGNGMAERQAAAVGAMQSAQADYIRSVAAGGSAPTPADQISTAKALLDSGTITQAEFDALKAKALA